MVVSEKERQGAPSMNRGFAVQGGAEAGFVTPPVFVCWFFEAGRKLLMGRFSWLGWACTSAWTSSSSRHGLGNHMNLGGVVFLHGIPWVYPMLQASG